MSNKFFIAVLFLFAGSFFGGSFSSAKEIVKENTQKSAQGSMKNTMKKSVGYSAPSVCLKGKIKTRLMQKESIEDSGYCTNSDGDELLSQNCKDSAKCLALSFKNTRDKKEIKLDQVGTPGFHLCTELKGEGQIIEFVLPSGKWVQLDRCLFSDHSFIDVGSLMENTYR